MRSGFKLKLSSKTTWRPFVSYTLKNWLPASVRGISWMTRWKKRQKLKIRMAMTKISTARCTKNFGLRSEISRNWAGSALDSSPGAKWEGAAGISTRKEDPTRAMVCPRLQLTGMGLRYLGSEAAHKEVFSTTILRITSWAVVHSYRNSKWKS